MATLTSVTNVSTKEEATFTYTFNALKTMANESSDVTAFRITSISNLGSLKAGSGAYLFTESSGVISMNGVAISELWYSTAGVTVIPVSGSNQVITGSFTWTPVTNYFGLATAFTIKGGTVVGATGTNLTSTDVPVRVNVTNVNDAPVGYCWVVSSGNPTTPVIGDYLIANSNISDPDGISTGAITYTFLRSTDNGSTWNDIAGTSGKFTYTLTSSDVGTGILVRARGIYTDNGGTVESFNSLNCIPQVNTLTDSPSAKDASYIVYGNYGYTPLSMANVRFKTALNKYTLARIYDIDSAIQLYGQYTDTATGKVTSVEITKEGLAKNFYSIGSAAIAATVTTAQSKGVQIPIIKLDSVIARKVTSNSITDLAGVKMLPCSGGVDNIAGSDDDSYFFGSTANKLGISLLFTSSTSSATYTYLNGRPTFSAEYLYVDENVAVGTVLANFSLVDYLGVSAGLSTIDQTYGDYAAFSIDTSGNLILNVSPDYETKNSYVIKVNSKTVYIKINDLAEGTDLYFKQNGSFVQAKEVHIKQNDAFVKAKAIYTKQNGSWVQV